MGRRGRRKRRKKSGPVARAPVPEPRQEPRARTAGFAAAIVAAAVILGFVVVLAVIFLDAGDLGIGERTGYVGSDTCGSCHEAKYAAWKQTLHATMVQPATPATVVGDFQRNNEYWLRDGVYGDTVPAEDRLLVRMDRRGSDFLARIYDARSGKLNPYRITHVVGTTFRQVYLVESRGTFFRVPIQWSIPQQRWVNLWNRQMRADETPSTPMDHFLNRNGHWDEFCARCHTTGYHAEGGGRWAELGIACESCHGPGSAHTAYFRDSLRLRVRSKLLGALGFDPHAFIVRATRLEPARSVAVCGQCHQADIWMKNVNRFIAYEPGEDLAAHFREIPLEPDTQEPPSNKTWPDGSPRGAGVLFRSFVESRCFTEGGVTCVGCHDPHLAGQHRALRVPGARSDRFCETCHGRIAADVAGHTHHQIDREGSRCYGCHLPRTLEGLTMVGDFGYRHVRTHELDHIPYPESSVRFGGPERMPNACNDCHTDKSARWAAEWTTKWWGSRERIGREIRARFEAAAGKTGERTGGL